MRVGRVRERKAPIDVDLHGAVGDSLEDVARARFELGAAC